MTVHPWLSRSFASLLVLVCSHAALASTLFEGWSKVLINGEHKGLVVQRVEFDEKKKQFKSTHYLKASNDPGDMVESLVAISDEKLKPISFRYSGVIDKKTVLIEGRIETDKTPNATPSKTPAPKTQTAALIMRADITEAGKKRSVTTKLPEGAFLSSFLGYVMLQGKEGIKKGVRYEYNAILEESASLAKGEAHIVEEKPTLGISSFRVLNTLQGSKYISVITSKAEVLETISPSQGVSTQLVAKRSEAEGPVKVADDLLKTVFEGRIPEGSQNEIAKRLQSSPVQAKNPSQLKADEASNPEQVESKPSAEATPPAAPKAKE